MTKPRVTLVTSRDYPELEEDERGLPDALAERGMDPRIAVWDDPDVDWDEANVCIVRSVRDYARRRKQFVEWAHSVPKLLNPADVIEWASDKHYMRDLADLGMPVVPTTWLEPEQGLSKHQVHTRFPALGDFVVKPAVSSGGREMGRYTANSGESRMRAILRAMSLLDDERAVMVQRYLNQVDEFGEISLVYFNGILSHAVQKSAMLQPAEETGQSLQDEVVESHEPTAQEWEWGEQARRAIHTHIFNRVNHDQLLLYCRVDIVEDGEGGCYVMEISPVDANLFLTETPGALDRFAEAIASRVLW
ncbi:ATP-grasp domain-containing protein [Nanchangia anserum]|uniref:Glutathione synthetase n=1 Tax=Nanchangia anserum TaxID=2692125 RepID=A0A8I0GC88_9ACTO|nr:glutathione synthetase [Nanchangia anserum]MBD3688893.1 glutathione synthetase [Nanchangia anserum]